MLDALARLVLLCCVLALFCDAIRKHRIGGDR